MKQIISSDTTSALYYASGMADGNGLTAGSPRLWHAASADGGATVPWTGSETTPIFVALSLTGGLEYTFSFSYMGGDMYGYISTLAAPGTILQYLYPWDVMTFTPPTSGIYLLQVGYDMAMEPMAETIGCSPQPQVIPTSSGWQRRTIATSKGFSRYGKITPFDGYRHSPVSDGLIFDFCAQNGIMDVSPSKQPIITIGRPVLCGGMLYLDANSYFQLPILLTGNAARSHVVTMRITGHGPFLGAGRTGYNNQDWTVYTSDTRIILNGWNNDHIFSTTVPFSGFVTFGLSYTNGSLAAYVQGNPVFSAAPNAFDTFADNPWFFGGAPNGNRGKAVGFFPCCQIYNRFLSADEHAKIAVEHAKIIAELEV